MIYFQVLIKLLYNERSILDIGTMRAAQARISRTNFNPNVMEAYEYDKDFIISFIRANVVEAMMSFFGIPDINSPPQKNIPPKFNSEEERKEWVYRTMGNFVRTFIMDAWQGQAIDAGK